MEGPMIRGSEGLPKVEVLRQSNANQKSEDDARYIVQVIVGDTRAVMFEFARWTAIIDPYVFSSHPAFAAWLFGLSTFLLA